MEGLMAKRKWTTERRARFAQTVALRKKSATKQGKEPSNSGGEAPNEQTAYLMEDGKLVPLKQTVVGAVFVKV
jgi:hypothetical protein